MIERLRVQIPAEAAEEFTSQELTFCADSYSVSVPTCVTAMARKKPGHSSKSAGGRLRLNTHTPLAQRSQCGLTMLSMHSVGTVVVFSHTF